MLFNLQKRDEARLSFFNPKTKYAQACKQSQKLLRGEAAPRTARAGSRGSACDPAALTAEGINLASSTGPLLRRHLPRERPLTAGDARTGAKTSAAALRMRQAQPRSPPLPARRGALGDRVRRRPP